MNNDRDSANHIDRRSGTGRSCPTLSEYIRIPNKSQSLRSAMGRTRSHGSRRRADAHVVRSKRLAGHEVEIVRLPGRTPLLFIEVPAANGVQPNDCVLMYGHMDKQPEFTGWAEGLVAVDTVSFAMGDCMGAAAPTTAMPFSASCSRCARSRNKTLPHARCVILIEARRGKQQPRPARLHRCARRSHRRTLAGRLPRCRVRQLRPVLVYDVVARQSGRHAASRRARGRRAFGHGERHRAFELSHHCANCSRASKTRRPAGFSLDALARGHSQAIGCNRHARLQERWARPCKASCRCWTACSPCHSDPAELLLNSTWRPTLSVTGVDGIPPLTAPATCCDRRLRSMLSFRLPPGVDPRACGAAVKQTLEQRSALRRACRVQCRIEHGRLECAIECAVARSSDPGRIEELLRSPTRCTWARAAAFPSWRMLSEKFPGTQFLVTGVLGPQSNAHGPNEFLDIATGKKVTACVAHVVAAHATARSDGDSGQPVSRVMYGRHGCVALLAHDHRSSTRPHRFASTRRQRIRLGVPLHVRPDVAERGGDVAARLVDRSGNRRSGRRCARRSAACPWEIRCAA